VVASVRVGPQTKCSCGFPGECGGRPRHVRRPSPFRLPFRRAIRRSAAGTGKEEIRSRAGDRSGETRTRTGDTTIFSRAVAVLERAQKACKYPGFSSLGTRPHNPQIAADPRRFGRREAVRLPLAPSDASVAIRARHSHESTPATSRPSVTTLRLPSPVDVAVVVPHTRKCGGDAGAHEGLLSARDWWCHCRLSWRDK
jgi:hypothetical protein